MATNKNAMLRYKILDSCFRNIGKKYFITNLIEECNKVLLEINPTSKGISRRQIFEDILFMQSSQGWSVQLSKLKEGRKVFYRYEDSSFSINNMPFNNFEIHQFQLAINILSQFKGMPQFEWVNEFSSKLSQGFIVEKTNPIIEFDANQYLKGIDHLGILYNAIYHKKVLSIKYKVFGNLAESEILVIHPYYLKQYNNRWFLYGYNPEKEKFDWNMALDRIVTISENKNKYIENQNINWEEYFEDIIGVTKKEDNYIQNIKLNFYGKTGNYIISKPLHGSQRAKWINNEILEVNLKLILNYELENLILSYAECVQVLSPPELISTIANRLNLASNNYN